MMKTIFHKATDDLFQKLPTFSLLAARLINGFESQLNPSEEVLAFKGREESIERYKNYLS